MEETQLGIAAPGVPEAPTRASRSRVRVWPRRAFADSVLTGAFLQTVHARTSFKHSEVLWGVRFSDIFLPSGDGRIAVDVGRINYVDES